MTRITFLGTGGGRFTTIYQIRATGGVYLDDGIKIHIDPGPGALVQMHRFKVNPTKTDIIAVSHAHTDHYTDAEVLIEAITNGGTKKKGLLVGSKSVIEGYDIYDPAISKYHMGLVEKVASLSPGNVVRYRGIKIRATKSYHNDPTTIGFKIETSHGIVSYLADTDYSDSLARTHRNARVLILPVTRPLGAKIPYHLSTKEAAKLVAAIKPEIAILTHFGLKMIEENPDFQADWIWKETGVRTIAADDGMVVEIGRDIEII
ncbi:metal-dependent hydrolase, beta-lactamase superfamily III [Aciduliprofundum sp. MAR08-339]|uniref:MBL fold metallo-hydrolase n=1 Tax=Aciduliprofundum sp. (strain MAR08-339) TaxID=673860 RepID=UPI0002A4B88A|nr:metal-dependent hydrolase, beta-lactamase superfamily III [Aciduliprofundum sp. MAR08-339]